MKRHDADGAETTRMRKHDTKRANRSTFYNLCILVVLAITAGRICSVTSKEGDTAFLSANDRSRWCTVASLVEDGTYEIDRLVNFRNEKKRRPWYTIDMVRHQGADGQQHYYSSKPPLFPTMVAGVNWIVNKCSGMKMSEQPIYVPRIVLLLVNLPLMALFCWCTIWSMEFFNRGDWSRRFLAAATCFGTMLTPFAITLNNHLPAAACTAVVMYLYLRAAEKLDDEDAFDMRDMPHWFWLIAGIAAGFTAANELPALSMLVLWGVLIYRLSRPAILPFVGGVAIVAVAFLGTNYLAHEAIRPAYAHRGNGGVVKTFSTQDQPSQDDVAKLLVSQNFVDHDQLVQIEPSGDTNRLRVTNDRDGLQFALIKNDSTGEWTLNHWDDWYDYPSSYWNDGNRKGVDLGEPSRLVYLFNMTIGHHGIFSITPLWFLVPFGLFYGLKHGPFDHRRLVGAIAIASGVCLVFYLMRPEIDRNYGGVSSCFRWMLWFAPLWLLVSGPFVEQVATKQRDRNVLSALLAFSIFSVSIALTSPWQPPWIQQFWSFLGWI
ncbi:MAG: hypothetical protein WBD20_11495 [Pirellulaceae bacterium]